LRVEHTRLLCAHVVLGGASIRRLLDNWVAVLTWNYRFGLGGPSRGWAPTHSTAPRPALVLVSEAERIAHEIEEQGLDDETIRCARLADSAWHDSGYYMPPGKAIATSILNPSRKCGCAHRHEVVCVDCCLGCVIVV
jgi:hypothetical protein